MSVFSLKTLSYFDKFLSLTWRRFFPWSLSRQWYKKKIRHSSTYISSIYNCHHVKSMAGDRKELCPFFITYSIQNTAVSNAAWGRSWKSREKWIALLLKILKSICIFFYGYKQWYGIFSTKLLIDWILQNFLQRRLKVFWC